MDTTLDEAFFRSLVDFEAVELRVRQRLAVLSSGADVLRFFAHYASWNGCFANGVAALTSLVGNSRDLFREPGFARATADRSNYIASFFFDAARDEYDDHINPARDSHRCMAQAALISMQGFFGLGPEVLDEAEPAALREVNEAVLAGYTGQLAGQLAGQPSAARGRVAQTFAAMGYHLGSELLADREFSLIDEHLRLHRNDLVQHLLRSTVELAGGTHRCYAWVGVHSGHGGGVEADHFDHAAEGARLALRFLAAGSASEALEGLVAGFRAFDQDHARFFAIAAP
ncbi:hypothetical protein [Aquabacterium sp.]|uniref:hypothetical protein n=1 Tax=Aquabacterium sp. TaxID=1872578 RepID=UPI002C5AC8C9|nr:hypothetical protein [Aquabacterium sp.]HSW06769.1 hypothetical protein [Aquabacterium sp.]